MLRISGLSYYNRLIPLVVIGVSILIVMMPLLLHNDILDSIVGSADMKAHTDVVRQYSVASNTDGTLYWGQKALAVIMSPLGKSINLDTFYLWLSFLVLIIMIVTLYYVVRKLAGRTSALLVLPMILFCTPSIISLFKYGVIFSIINMYIILPIALLLGIYWVTKRKIYYLLSSLVVFTLFSAFHFTSMYLPYGLGLAIVVYLIYAIVRRQWGYVKPVLLLGIPVILLNIVMTALLMDSRIAEVGGYSLNINGNNILSMLQVITSHIYLVPVLLLCGIFIVWLPRYGMKNMGAKINAYLIILISFVIVLFGGIMLEITTNILYINRMATDLAVLLTIAVACVIGYILDSKKSKPLSYAVYGIVCFGSIPVITMWI